MSKTLARLDTREAVLSFIADQELGSGQCSDALRNAFDRSRSEDDITSETLEAMGAGDLLALAFRRCFSKQAATAIIEGHDEADKDLVELRKYIKPDRLRDLISEMNRSLQLHDAIMDRHYPDRDDWYGILLDITHKQLNGYHGVMRLLEAVVREAGEQNRAAIIGLFKVKFANLPIPSVDLVSDSPSETEDAELSIAEIVFYVLNGNLSHLNVSAFSESTLTRACVVLRDLGFAVFLSGSSEDRTERAIRMLNFVPTGGRLEAILENQSSEIVGAVLVEAETGGSYITFKARNIQSLLPLFAPIADNDAD